MTAQIQQNVSLLLYLWLSRATGHLHLTDPEGLRGAVMPMANGALLDGADMRDLSSRLGTHVASLVPGPVQGEGSRRRMGTVLQLLTRRHQVDFAAAYEWEWLDHAQLDLGSVLGATGVLDERLMPEVVAAAAARDARQERLLQRGVALIARGDWAEADEALSQARDLRIDDPLTLAYLALARANNPRRSAPERAHDARSFARLAAQLAPDEPEVRALVDAVSSGTPTGSRRVGAA